MSLFDTRETLMPTEKQENDGLDAVVSRESEYERLQSVIRDLETGSRERCVVVGPQGSGKTTLVRRSLDDVTRARVSWVDCSDVQTAYGSVIDTFEQVRQSSGRLASTGYSFETVRTRLRDHLRSSTNKHVLVFDEVETLDDHAPLGALGELDGVSLVGISNDPSLTAPAGWEDLAVVRFEPYDIRELRSTLSTWSSRAFRDGALSSEVVPLCAAYGAEAGGDARKAVTLLRRAGDIAQQELASQVRGNHVEQAKRELKSERLRTILDSLDAHSHLLLYAMLSLDEEDRLPARTAAIRSRYEPIARDAGTEPLTERRTYDRFRTLADSGVLAYTQHNEGRSGGVYRTYSFSCDVETVRSILSESELVIVDYDAVDGLF